MEVEQDPHGNIPSHPVTAWGAAAVSRTSIVLAVRYTDSSEGIEGGKQVQLALTALQSLAIAKKLTALATHALEAPGGPSAAGHH